MPDDSHDRLFPRRIDDLVNQAGSAASEYDWTLSPSDILGATRPFRSRPVVRGVGVVLLAAVIVIVFVVPLPGLHLFGSRTGSRSSTTTTSTRPPARTRPKPWTGSVMAVHFLNAYDGWVVTDRPNRLLFTSNGGKDWSDVTPPGARDPNVSLTGPDGAITGSFRSGSDWWIATSLTTGAGSIRLYETDDAGRDWRQSGSVFAGNAVSIFFLDAGHGWLEATPGAASGWNPVTIYRTTNGGSTWTELSKSPSLPGQGGTPGALPGACDKVGLSFNGASTGWAAQACNGSTGELARTDDGGRKWSIVDLSIVPAPTGGVSAWAPVFSSPSAGAFGLAAPGDEEVVYSTSNGGATWVEHRAPLQLAKADSIEVISAAAWLIPDGTSLYVTSDAGRSWSTVRSGTNLATYEVDFTSVDNGWAWSTSDRPALLRTTDGGRRWSKVTLSASIRPTSS